MDQARLTEAERQELIPSGQQTIASNRIAWAKTYLKKAGLITQPARATIRITPEGQKVLAGLLVPADPALHSRTVQVALYDDRLEPPE